MIGDIQLYNYVKFQISNFTISENELVTEHGRSCRRTDKRVKWLGFDERNPKKV